MVIVNETLIMNKYNDEYQKIKNQLNCDSIEERFLYHGSFIINNEFLSPVRVIQINRIMVFCLDS